MSDIPIPDTKPYILALQHSPSEPLGILGEVLAETGVGIKYVRSFDGEPVPLGMGNAAALVVLGGPMGVADQARFPFLTYEMCLIAQALNQGCPVLGICLGSQLLAHTLGAEVRRAPRLEIGWHPITVKEPRLGIFQGFPASFTGFHWHGDYFTLPRGAAALAHSELTPCQAFHYGENVYGIQFHMEVTDAIIRDWVASGSEELSDAGVTPEAILFGIESYLPAQQQIARTAFQRWVNEALSASHVTI